MERVKISLRFEFTSYSITFPQNEALGKNKLIQTTGILDTKNSSRLVTVAKRNRRKR
jgi:hypothetical protein